MTVTQEELEHDVIAALRACGGAADDWASSYVVRDERINAVEYILRDLQAAINAYKKGATSKTIIVDLGCGSKSCRTRFVIPVSIDPGTFLERFAAYIAASGPYMGTQMEENDSGN